MSDDQTRRAFHRFRLAVARHGVTPDRLDPGRLDGLEGHVAEAEALERRALANGRALAARVAAERVAARLAEAEAAHGGGGAFAATLAACGLDRAAFAAGVERELRFDALMRAVGAGVPDPAPERVRVYFASHPDRFAVPETRTVRHILITVNLDHPGNHPVAARARADDIVRRLAAEPGAFAELARAHSECPTALAGGLVGTVPRGRLYPELDAVAFALPAGGVAGPVETALGFHIVRCDAIHPAGARPFAEVAADIRALLARGDRRAARRAWLEAPP